MVAATTTMFGYTGVAIAFAVVVTMLVASRGHLGGAHIDSNLERSRPPAGAGAAWTAHW